MGNEYDSISFDLVGLAGAAEIRQWRSPSYPVDLVAVSVECHSAPSSASGTYLLTIANGSTNLLHDTSFALTGLVADTQSKLTVAIPEYLGIAADTLITITATSSASDLVRAAGLRVTLSIRRQ